MQNATILPCPSCSRRLRMPADKVISTQCPACGRQFKVAYGKVQDDPLATGAGGKVNGLMERYKSWAYSKGNPFYLKPWALIVMLGVLFYGGRYFIDNVYKEYQAHNAFTANPGVETGNDYLAAFPSSDNAKAVRQQRDSFQLEAAAITIDDSCDLGLCNCDVLNAVRSGTLSGGLRARYATLREDCAFRTAAEDPTMGNVNGFLAKYSNSLAYADSIESIRRYVLNGLVANYDANLELKGAAPSSNQTFFRNALGFVSETGNNQIVVDFTQRKNLKDWDDYSQEVRDATDNIMELSNTLEGTSHPTPGNRPPGSINKFFQSNTGELESFLVKSIQTKIDSIFGEKTLLVRKVQDGRKTEGIVLNVEYLVSTLEDDFGEMGTIPSLYVWTQTESGGYGSSASTIKSRFKGYMLATGIEWDLSMDYPGAKGRYTYQQSSRPNAEIRDINTESAALTRMMATAFDDFSKSFLAEFGVE